MKRIRHCGRVNSTSWNNQREQAKNDLADAQKKFEMTLQQLQKYRKNDKTETENNQSALVASVEKRYQTQIQDVTVTFQQKIQELEDKTKKLEKELKTANDKFLVDNYGKMGNQSFIEKRMTEMGENEKRLQLDLANTKSERDAKILDYTKTFDKRKGNP